MIGYPGTYLKTGQDSPGSWGCENGWVVREESDKGEEMGSRTRGLEGRRGRSVVGLIAPAEGARAARRSAPVRSGS